MGVVFRSTLIVDKTCPWRKMKRMKPLNCRKSLIFEVRREKDRKVERKDVRPAASLLSDEDEPDNLLRRVPLRAGFLPSKL